MNEALTVAVMPQGSKQEPRAFAQAVLEWHSRHGRTDLPWQLDKTPYRVWLSEIMLQQTQVATVIPYYQRFLKTFPDLQSLADASIDQVLQHWQGLGYYARARNLHRAAQIIRDQHAGQFPQAMDQLTSLPGIGRSTAGAILSLACGQNWPILDGNVKRVLARCFQVAGWYGQGKTMKTLWQIAEQLTPASQTGEYNQAMMDLGAMVCVKTSPRCEVCPLTECCASFEQGTQTSFPEKKPPKPKPNKQTLMLLHRYQDRILLYRRPPTGIWGGLWSLPEVAGNEDIADWQSSYLADTKSPGEIKPDVLKHQFTHYSLDISLALIDLNKLPQKVADQNSIAFVAPSELPQYGLPTPVRKLLSMELSPNPY